MSRDFIQTSGDLKRRPIGVASKVDTNVILWRAVSATERGYLSTKMFSLGSRVFPPLFPSIKSMDSSDTRTETTKGILRSPSSHLILQNAVHSMRICKQIGKAEK